MNLLALRAQIAALREQATAISLQAETLYRQVDALILDEPQPEVVTKVFGNKQERKHFMEEPVDVKGK